MFPQSVTFLAVVPRFDFVILHAVLYAPGRPGRRMPGGVRPLRRHNVPLPDMLRGKPVGYHVRGPGDVYFLGRGSLYHGSPRGFGRRYPAVLQRFPGLRSGLGGRALLKGWLIQQHRALRLALQKCTFSHHRWR